MRVAVAGVAAVALLAGCQSAPRQADVLFESYRAHLAAAHSARRLGEFQESQRWIDATPVRDRGWEWDYLSATAEESSGIVRLSPRTAWPMAAHPDGVRLALGLESGAVQVWNLAASPRIEAVYTGHGGAITGLGFNADASRLVTTSFDRKAIVWNTQTGDPVWTFAEHKYPVGDAAFLPDGKRVVSCSYSYGKETGFQGEVFLWDAASGAVAQRFLCGRKPLVSLDVSPDGRFAAAGSWDFVIFLCDLEKGGEPRALALPDGLQRQIDSVSFSPDGRFAAGAAKGGETFVWNVADGALAARLGGHRGEVHAAAFSPKGDLLATAGQEGSVRLWTTADWKEKALLLGHGGAVHGLAWLRGGAELVSSSTDKTLRRWDPAASYGALRIRTEGPAYSVTWDRSGERLLTAGGAIATWDAGTGRRLAQWTGHIKEICTGAFLPSGDTITCSWDGTAILWDAESHAEVRRFDHGAGVAFVAASPNGRRIATAGVDGKAKLWNAATGALEATLDAGKQRLKSVAFSPGGGYVAASGDADIRVWRADGAEPVATMPGHAGGTEALAFLPDGWRLATGGEDGAVRVWEWAKGELLRELHDGDEPVYRLAASPDGRRLAAGTTGALLFLDPDRPGALLATHPQETPIWHLSFSPEGSRLATTGWDGNVVVLRAE